MIKLSLFFGICSLAYLMKSTESHTRMPASTFKSKESIKQGQSYFLKAIFVHGSKIGVQGDKAYINFDLKTQQTSGYTACNIFSSPFRLKGKKLTFNKITSSTQICPDYLDGLESDYLEALGNVQNYTINMDHSLILMNKNDTLLIFHE